MRWTDAQRDAIDARGSNLLVSAAAGSGKTAVLAERIVALVKEGMRIDELLVVTFTRAAAAEMRARILTALHDAAQDGDSHVSAQAMRVERADITTLHGLCSRICRDFFQAAEIDPTFRIADGPESAVLFTQAMTEAIVGCYEAKSYAFEMASLCLDQEALINSVSELYRFAMARPDPWQWLQQAVISHDMTAAALKDSDWMRVLLERVQLDAAQAEEDYRQLAAYAQREQAFVDLALAEAEYPRVLREAAVDYDALMTLEKPVFLRKPNKPKDMPSEVNDRFMQLRKVAQERLKEAYARRETMESLQDLAKDEIDIGLVAAGLQEAVTAFAERFAALKRERNVMDFSDLEHFSLKALRHPEVAETVRLRYKQIFVDEYQDSSMLQEALLRHIAREDNLFMVGDVKQSIYRFRLAEPTLFLEKLNRYEDREGALCRKIMLNANFRSTGTIVRGINAVFARVFSGGPMELQYGEDAQLIQGRECAEDTQKVELHLLMGQEESDADEDSPTMEELAPDTRQAIQKEAEVMADRIKALQASEPGRYRLRDMAVLLRTVQGKAALVVETLRSSGIMAWSDVGEDALQRPEVHAMISLLQVIDNLRQDIPLMAALRGPALGLGDDALSEIRMAMPDGTFADAVLSYAEKDDLLGNALKAFIEKVRGWMLDAQVMPLDCLLRQVYEETGHYAQAGALPDGSIRQANLRRLAEYAGQYQRAQAGGLSGFMRYLEQVRAQEGMAAQELGEQDDVLRVMSIHKSKGLQFPVVFVAGMGRKLMQMDAKKPVQLHAHLGIGMAHVDPAMRTKRKSISREAILEKRRQESIAEEARVLYVAMTRAQDRLILIGSAKEDNLSRWEDGGEARAVGLPKTMLDWVVPAAILSEDWTIMRHDAASAPLFSADRQALERVAAEVYALKEPPASSREAEALSWTPSVISGTPLKQSVSSVVAVLAKAGEAEDTPVSLESLPKRPLFMESRGLNAAERGEAVHAFLRAVPLDIQDLEAFRRIMQERGQLSQEEANALPMDKLRRIMRHPLWGRMRNAQRLFREKPFNLGVTQEGRTTLLQGVIDCCFLEGDEWVVVDYKTDRVEDEQALIDRYRLQLSLYAKALTEITGLSVKETILFSVDREEAYEV